MKIQKLLGHGWTGDIRQNFFYYYFTLKNNIRRYRDDPTIILWQTPHAATCSPKYISMNVCGLQSGQDEQLTYVASPLVNLHEAKAMGEALMHFAMEKRNIARKITLWNET